MPQIILKNTVIDDDWEVLRLGERDDPQALPLPPGRVIFPLAIWQARAAECANRAEYGVWLSSDTSHEALEGDLNQFSVIALDFPKFTDGRAYSTATLLRTRRGYHGQLRAIGDVLRDQLFYLQRSGFDAFAVRTDKDIHAARASLADFSLAYQGSADNPEPLFRRVRRPGADETAL